MDQGILSGVDGLIDNWLGLGVKTDGTLPWFQHRAVLLRLQKDPPENLDGMRLFEDLVRKITDNWKSASPRPIPSVENWRFTKELVISPDNFSPERTLEKCLALLTDENWANQIPTCSGLPSGRGRNIDLAHRDEQPGHFTFYELKVDSNTPLFAAFEVLIYGALYAFSRKHAGELGYLENEPIQAGHVALKVLAPAAYYDGYDLGWIRRPLQEGLTHWSQKSDAEFTLSFGFESFPPEFVWQPPNRALKERFEVQ